MVLVEQMRAGSGRSPISGPELNLVRIVPGTNRKVRFRLPENCSGVLEVVQVKSEIGQVPKRRGTSSGIWSSRNFISQIVFQTIRRSEE